MNKCYWSFRAISFVPKILFLSIALFGLGACATTTKIRNSVRPKPLESPSTGDKAEVYSEIAAAQRKRNEVFVQIIGSDIELPLTSGPSKPSDIRTYTIDVWFDDSVIENGDIHAAIKRGDVIVEVLGSKAKLLPAVYGKKPDAPLPKSRNKIVVEVDSRDITQAFTIIAKAVTHSGKWQQEQEVILKKLKDELQLASNACKEKEACVQYLIKNRELISAEGSIAAYRKQATGINESEREGVEAAIKYLDAGQNYESAQTEQNPYMAVKTIRVFNGDLQTQIYMLSDEESRDAFGSNFSKYFYVGKAYFRNRHTENKLIIHTTSLRAKALFYREPVSDDQDSWYERLIPNHSEHDDVDPIGRYDYILDSYDRELLLAGELSGGEEKQILNIVFSEEVISRLIDSGDKKDDLIESLLEKVGKTLDLKNEGRKQKAEKIARFSIEATKRSIKECKVPNDITGNKEIANFYAQTLDGLESGLNTERLIQTLISDGKKERYSSRRSFLECMNEAQVSEILNRSRMFGSASPVTLDLRKRVGLSDKVAAASRDTYWQQRLSRHGYHWHDYYRPMTFEAVLLSLAAKTKSHPNNRAIEYLQSIGVIAGSLVGMTEISSRFGTEDFAQRVAYTTGVFIPEFKKLFMRDLDQYLANLATTALPSIITLAPNESRDGYVFFPRGAIYGYGVDEFSINEPSYIINIDNEDVAVDGALIEGELPFASGQKALDAVQSARDQGKSRVAEDMKKLADLQAKAFAYQLQYIANNACEMIAAGEAPEAQTYLNAVTQGVVAGNAAELISELKARAKESITCDKPLPAPNPSKSQDTSKP